MMKRGIAVDLHVPIGKILNLKMSPKMNLIGVSFNKIFAKLGSDYKKPDAITTMHRDEYREKAWPLPASDLLYVGRSTSVKLQRLGIRTIGDLATTDEKILHSQLGKMGDILWAFANGYDDSPVKYENAHAPIKSIGNSTTTPEKQMKVDEAVDTIRKRFGFYSVQRGLMYFDRALSAVDAKAEHTVHPHGYFSG